MHKNVDALHQEHTLLPESFPNAGGVCVCVEIFNPFSMNILHYNQYHQYQMKLDPLRKWCIEAVLSHS